MTLQAPKGTRDFYPQDMVRRNYLFDTWRRVSVRNGFEEFDGPAFETLELYTAKSGDEIVSQLFRMTDRGGRDLALRPELTPSLARMVNQRSAALPMPIKWFSIPRLWRAERPQRGRLREFFQWNIDIVGSELAVADAECIFVAIDALRELGLTSADVVVKISSRPLLAAVLIEHGVPREQLPSLYVVVDKQAKVPPDKFMAMLAEALAAAGVADPEQAASRLALLLKSTDLDSLAVASESAAAEKAAMKTLLATLADFGVAGYCQFDLGVVRGLAYYTGAVFEVYDRATSMRAVAGGGRYDNLLEVLGGPKVPAVGFGMGDVVLADLLDTLGKWPATQARADAFLIDADERLFPEVVKLAGRLRTGGLSALFSYRRAAVGKQFKQASQSGARFAVVLGNELSGGQVTVKNLASGEQKLVQLDQVESALKNGG
jgi:histidyl-tRNA synthetase